MPALPNSSQIKLAHNIFNIEMVVDYKGIFKSPSDNSYLVFNYVSPNGIQYGIGGWVDHQNIEVVTKMNRTNYTENYVTVYYTCTDR